MNTDFDHEPMVSISISRLNAAEIAVMRNWCNSKIEIFPTFAAWVGELLANEVARREDSGRELGMHALPKWNGEQLADALTGSYILCRLPLSPAIANWVDELHKLIVANCSAALETFVGEVVT